MNLWRSRMIREEKPESAAKDSPEALWKQCLVGERINRLTNSGKSRVTRNQYSAVCSYIPTADRYCNTWPLPYNIELYCLRH